MDLSKSNILKKVLLLLLAMLIAVPSFAQYTDFRIVEPRKGGEPEPRAIMWSVRNPKVLLHYKDEHLILSKGDRLDNDWHIKEIKRESVIFGRDSQQRYIEIYIDPAKRPDKVKNVNWSLYALPISMWEAIELVTECFGRHAVMHNLCFGAVTANKVFGRNLMEIMNQIMPSHSRLRLEKDTLYALPATPPHENWLEPLKRKRQYDHKALQARFPNLAKSGYINSRGKDIQYILRVIALGGGVPISFPKGMHFSVYCNYKGAPFSKILCDIAYINQCIVVEREFGLDVMPWPAKPQQQKAVKVYEREPVPMPEVRFDMLTADPIKYDEISGSGPYPPAITTDPIMMPAIVVDKIKSISKYKAPVVMQKPAVKKAK